MNSPGGTAAPRTWSSRKKITGVAAVAALLAIAATGAVATAQPWKVGAAGAATDAVTAVAVPTSRPAALGAPRDPLSLEEWGYASHLAQTSSAVPTDATDSQGEPGAELLSVNVPNGDVDGADRLAQVSLYDYTSDAQYDVLVDLTSGEVVSDESSDDVQSPTTQTENDEAMDLFLASDLSATVKQQFEERTGAALTSADQVSYTGGSFLAGDSVIGADECGAHRCVQMQVQAPDGTYLTTTNFVVDLSARAVIEIK